jgi:predicted NAD/FAD-binding protein
VIFACHSDEALALLVDKTQDEVNVLGAMPYQNNEVVLHTDENMLPKRKLAWSSWNYLLGHKQQSATLSYNMNILQGIKAPVTFCVTLNASEEIDESKKLATFQYAHPVFTLKGMQAQQQWPLINGVNNRWFCGAYWRNGFHEDGVVSALNVVNGILKKWNKPQIEILAYE